MSYVQRELKSKSLLPKALLTLDNCSALPEENILVSDDGLVIAKFFPPIVTSLIQPMDQDVLESMKRRYKRSLLQEVLLSEDLVDPTTFTKSITMKVVIEKISLAWDQITPVTICRSWKTLIPLADVIPSNSDSDSTTVVLADTTPSSSDSELIATEFIDVFQSMGHTLSEDELQSGWTMIRMIQVMNICMITKLFVVFWEVMTQQIFVKMMVIMKRSQML